MGKREDEPTTARRSGSGGNRAKRPSATNTTNVAPLSAQPPQHTSRMEMMLAAAAASADPLPPPSAAAATMSHHYQAFPPPPAYHAHVYPPVHQQQQPQQQQQQQPHALPPAAPTDNSAKRKRVKKNDDEWPPAAATSLPPVASSSSMSISSLVAPPPAFAMPAASSSAASLSSILSAASPIPSAPSPTVSVFQAPPVPIQSFAETERQRRSAANGSASIATLGNGKSSNSSSSISRKSDSRSSNSSTATQLSMLDLFFPDTTAPSHSTKSTSAAAATDANGASKSLKRKRRGDAALSAPTTSTTAVEYDMLRFGVDSTKLIPQGLVDRVDAKMDRAFIAKLIESHVANWTKRAGFSATFLADATTLLTAYYPCHYPTILDEVLACFLFKRPEFTDVLLAPMVEKLQKLNEAATGAKYPVVEALARTCVPVGALADCARHDFACTTLLQSLVERNTDKFVLSPAIAACAMHCSDAVLATLARQLLRAWLLETSSSSDTVAAADATAQLNGTDSDRHTNGSPTASKSPANTHRTAMWHIVDANEQAFELLDEEKKLRARSADAGLSLALDGRSSRCRLARALVHLVLLDSASLTNDQDAFAALLASPLVQHALALVLSLGSVADTSALLLGRVHHLDDDEASSSSRASKARGRDEESPVAALLACFVSACTATTRSVPTTNWFSRHVLRFLLSSDAPALALRPDRRARLFALVVKRYMPLVLGAPLLEDCGDGDLDASHDPTTQRRTTDDKTSNTNVSWRALAVAEKLSVSDMVERLRRLLALLASVPPAHATAFLSAWAAAWTSTTPRVSVPWAYLHALVLVAVDDDLLPEPAHVRVRSAFVSLVTETCCAQFARLCASRLVDVLHLLLASSSAQTQPLLHTVVNAMRTREDASTSATLFTNAVLVRLSEGARVTALSTDSSSPVNKRSASSALKATSSTSSGSPLGAAVAAATPRTEVERHVLVALRHIAARDDATGAFVRAQLSTRAVLRLLTRLLRDAASSPSKLSALIELLEAVVDGSRAVSQRQGDCAESDTASPEWLRHHVIQQLVASAYSAQSAPIADRLAGLLQRLAQQQRDASAQSTLLWVTLRQCTQLCCGCGCGSLASPAVSAANATADSRRQHHVAAAGTFAELVKLLLLSTAASSSARSSNTHLSTRVTAFVQQELVSCRTSAPRLNLFLLLLLQKLASVPQPPPSCLAAVQLAVFSLGVTSRDHIRILQLQLLKALCARLVRLQTHARRRGLAGSSGSSGGDEQQRCEELVCNERLQLDLRRIVNAEGVGASSSRASVVLAQGVLAFAAELHRSKQQRAVLSR